MVKEKPYIKEYTIPWNLKNVGVGEDPTTGICYLVGD